jgi:hypothetical protein
MDEGSSCPAAHLSGAAAGVPLGNRNTEFCETVILSGRGVVGV